MSRVIPEKRQIRVAVVIPSHWSWRTGGSQQQAKILVERLACNFDANVRYFAARTGDRKHYDDHEVIDVSTWKKLHRYGHVWDYFRLQKELARFAPDVIYQRVFGAYTGIAAQFADRQDIPMIWHIANDRDCLKPRLSAARLRRPYKILDNWIGSRGIPTISTVIAQTKDQERLLQSNYGRRPDLIIRNFQPAPEPCVKQPTPFRVVWIANLKRVKRPELFLDLADRLSRQSSIRLYMAGAPYGMPKPRAEFDRLVSRLHNLNYLGELSLESVNALLDKAHLFVNTSSYEGFPNTFIQAWMRAVPVITHGINPDGLLNDEGLGFCCSNIDEMADKISKLASRREELEHIAAKCRTYALENFSLDNADKLAEIVVNAAGKKMSPVLKEMVSIG